MSEFEKERDPSVQAAIVRKDELAVVENIGDINFDAISSGFDEETRGYFLDTFSALIEQSVRGELVGLNENELQRVALLRTIEHVGMREFLTNPQVKSNKELQSYIDLARKIGNESQKMLEDARRTVHKTESIYDIMQRAAKEAYTEGLKEGKTLDIEAKYLSEDDE